MRDGVDAMACDVLQQTNISLSSSSRGSGRGRTSPSWWKCPSTQSLSTISVCKWLSKRLIPPIPLAEESE